LFYMEPIFKLVIVIHAHLYTPIPGEVLYAYQERYNRPTLQSCQIAGNAYMKKYNLTHVRTKAEAHCMATFDYKDV
jgi:hypothetical protein